jgi:surface polysaccharide O-acyltransferase-like enzyme
VNFNGGLDLPAIIYAFWEPFVAWGIIASLLVVFRERFNAPSAVWKRWGAQAYGAFIVHAPIVVALSVALSSATIPPALKFIIVGASSIVASFVVAAAVLRLPGARRVI